MNILRCAAHTVHQAVIVGDVIWLDVTTQIQRTNQNVQFPNVRPDACTQGRSKPCYEHCPLLVLAALIFRMFPARRRIYCKFQLLWPLKLEKLKKSTFHQFQASVTVLVSSPNVPIRCTRKRSLSQKADTTDHRVRLTLAAGTMVQIYEHFEETYYPSFVSQHRGCTYVPGTFLLTTDIQGVTGGMDKTSGECSLC